MAHEAPGKSNHGCISLKELYRIPQYDAGAEAWSAARHRPIGMAYPHHHSVNEQTAAKHWIILYSLLLPRD